MGVTHYIAKLEIISESKPFGLCFFYGNVRLFH